MQLTPTATTSATSAAIANASPSGSPARVRPSAADSDSHAGTPRAVELGEHGLDLGQARDGLDRQHVGAARPRSRRARRAAAGGRRAARPRRGRSRRGTPSRRPAPRRTARPTRPPSRRARPRHARPRPASTLRRSSRSTSSRSDALGAEALEGDLVRRRGRHLGAGREELAVRPLDRGRVVAQQSGRPQVGSTGRGRAARAAWRGRRRGRRGARRWLSRRSVRVSAHESGTRGVCRPARSRRRRSPRARGTHHPPTRPSPCPAAGGPARVRRQPAGPLRGRRPACSTVACSARPTRGASTSSTATTTCGCTCTWASTGSSATGPCPRRRPRGAPCGSGSSAAATGWSCADRPPARCSPTPSARSSWPGSAPTRCAGGPTPRRSSPGCCAAAPRSPPC